MSILLKVNGLKKHFPIAGRLFRKERKVVHAVDGVSFSIRNGETFALVGESGCGKTTTARLLLQLIEPTAGAIYFRGRNIFNLSQGEKQKLRQEMQMIFQDPTSSLNPRKTIYTILSQPYVWNHIVPKDEVESEVVRILESVGLTPPQLYMDRYIHQFSGGQKQRIAIARALSVRPKFIVADEPVSYLDVSIRATILNLMKQLKEKYGLTYLLITHDLAMVRSVSDTVAVMYLGKIMEQAPIEKLFTSPLHPYTQALLSAVPLPNPEESRARKIIRMSGDVPTPIDPPPGCRFQSRCRNSAIHCREEEPILTEVEKNHFVACHLIG